MPDSLGGNNQVDNAIMAELSSSVLETITPDSVSRPYSLQASMDQSFSLDITAEEILTRRSLAYLGGRRWGLARQERDKLKAVLEADSKPTILVDILTVYADLVEGQAKRAETGYLQLLDKLSTESDSSVISDIYLLSAYMSLVVDDIDLFEIPENILNTPLWARAQTTRTIYNSLHESPRHFVGDLGTIADSMIRVPGTKRINAVWLRALQGKILVYRGDFEWAERVLSYTLNRAEALVSWNEPLLQSTQKNLEIAQLGVQNLSVK